MFTDTHCHIYDEYYDDINVIKDLMDNNSINRVIINGIDRKSNEEVLDKIDKYDWMYGAIGIHPEVVDDYKEEDIKFIVDNLDNKRIIAIGEIGLDYYYTKENKDKQIELFNKQLMIAQDYNIPVIIHSREATMDTINILKKYKLRGVIHSFSGSYETAMEYIKMGFLIGINGVITFKNCNLKDAIKRIDSNNIILETDSPYLTPVPFRGKQNNPSHIKEIAQFVGDLYGISLVELSKITNDNIKRVFDI